MGIARDSRHKRAATGAKRATYRKKRKFELGRQAAMTKIGAKRVHTVRVRGGNLKYRALRLDTGNFSWGSEASTRKTRILGVVYNASNNELVRTNTLTKGGIIQIDPTPHRQWYEAHYGQALGRRDPSKVSEELEKKKSKSVTRKVTERQKDATVEPNLVEQFTAGRIYARIASRPGQSGRCDGYILEGKELEFYLKKIKSKKQ
jgi:small subunit ribosomal protein S8e